MIHWQTLTVIPLWFPLFSYCWLFRLCYISAFTGNSGRKNLNLVHPDNSHTISHQLMLINECMISPDFSPHYSLWVKKKCVTNLFWLNKYYCHHVKLGLSENALILQIVRQRSWQSVEEVNSHTKACNVSTTFIMQSHVLVCDRHSAKS